MFASISSVTFSIEHGQLCVQLLAAFVICETSRNIELYHISKFVVSE